MDVIRCNLTGLDYRSITRVHAKLSNNRKYGWFVLSKSDRRRRNFVGGSKLVISLLIINRDGERNECS